MHQKPYCSQAAPTATPSPVIRNAQMPYPRHSAPMQQPLQPFDGTDSTFTTENILNALLAIMVMTAGPEQVNSPRHETCILKQNAMIQTALTGPAQQWYSHLNIEFKRTGKLFRENFRRHLIINNRTHKLKILSKSFTRSSGEQISSPT